MTSRDPLADCIEIPHQRPRPRIFVFGYGSLIDSTSRRVTTPTAHDAWPVRVRGVRRGWWARGTATPLTTTFLGLLHDANAWCNGVLYGLTADELGETDHRERGYLRCAIDPTAVTMLDGRDQPPEGEIWAYFCRFPPGQQEHHQPTAQYPIVQSYLDICMNGAFEIEARYPTASGFVHDFVASTHGWNRFWVNDRVHPRRPYMYVPRAPDIDRVLSTAEATSDLFYDIEIEPASWEQQTPVRPV